MATDLRPFRIEEGSGFRGFEGIGIKLLNRKLIPEKIKEIRKFTEEMVTTNFTDVNWVCIYIDHWTFHGEKYMAIFSSYINNLENNYVLLDFVRVPDKTASTSSTEIIKVEERFRIQGKVKYINSDSAADMVATVNLLKPTVHIHCLAHRCHNCVISSFKVSGFEPIVNKISKLVEDINRNPSFYTNFTKYIEESNLEKEMANKIKTKMKKFIITRWNTLHDMIKDFDEKYLYIKDYLTIMDKFKEEYPNYSEYTISKYILEILNELLGLQYVFMTSNKGNISKIIFRLKYTINRIREIALNTTNTIMIMEEQFIKFIDSIEKHFHSGGYLDINSFETEKHIFIISSWLNPLNIKELLNSNTEKYLLEELKSIELELSMHPAKKICYANSTASQLFVLNNELDLNEVSLEIFVKYIIEQYKEFTSKYYGSSQNIIELYDSFNVLNYWKMSPIRGHSCFKILDEIIHKYFCIECSEIICESSFSYAKLTKGALRRNLKGSSLSDIMFLMKNHDISHDYIIAHF